MENALASSPINPHFFQPLLPGFHNHLNIPMDFFTKHIERITNEGYTVVKLKSDTSSMTWEVKMDGRRLTQGWEKFATTHDLRVGDIVVFKHDGALLFHVTCFGPSCCEIQYDDDDDDDDDDYDDDEDDGIQTSSDSKKNQKAAQAVSSSDPSCFVALVTSSNLSKDSLFLPKVFARSNGLMSRQCEIVLLNEDKKPWRLLLLPHKSDGRVYIKSGWRRFCHANRKTANDLLTFKLVQTGATPVLQLCLSEYNQKCLRASYSFSALTNQCKFLTLTLTPGILKNCKLRLPAAFVKANGIESARKITLLDRYGIKKTTSLTPEEGCSRMRLGKGWKEFCEVNGVKPGDSFKLELIEEEEDTTTHLLKFCSNVS